MLVKSKYLKDTYTGGPPCNELEIASLENHLLERFAPRFASVGQEILR